MRVLEQHFFAENEMAAVVLAVEWPVGVERISLANLIVNAILLAGGVASNRSWDSAGSWRVECDYMESGSNKRRVQISTQTEREISEEELIAQFVLATSATPRELLENTHAKVTFQALWSEEHAWLYASDEAIEVRLGLFGERKKNCATLAEAYEFSGIAAPEWTFEGAQPSNGIAAGIVQEVSGWGFGFKVEPSVRGWTARGDGLVVDGSTFTLALNALEVQRHNRAQNPGFTQQTEQR